MPIGSEVLSIMAARYLACQARGLGQRNQEEGLAPSDSSSSFMYFSCMAAVVTSC